MSTKKPSKTLDYKNMLWLLSSKRDRNGDRKVFRVSAVKTERGIIAIPEDSKNELELVDEMMLFASRLEAISANQDGILRWCVYWDDEQVLLEKVHYFPGIVYQGRFKSAHIRRKDGSTDYVSARAVVFNTKKEALKYLGSKIGRHIYLQEWKIAEDTKCLNASKKSLQALKGLRAQCKKARVGVPTYKPL